MIVDDRSLAATLLGIAAPPLPADERAAALQPSAPVDLILVERDAAASDGRPAHGSAGGRH